MKVAVIGASGNVGTALLRALAEEDQIEEIIAIARRVPDLTSSPYGAASWEQIDLATPILGQGEDDPVIDQLAQVLTGVDAVVHLAWMIQPNHQRDLIRRGNVEGTRRVIEACLRAGVGHLVCASSVGAYSRVDDDVARDESWPAEGIATSHYSVDKAAQERLLDDADSRGLSVARVRSAFGRSDQSPLSAVNEDHLHCGLRFAARVKVQPSTSAAFTLPSLASMASASF